MKGIIYTRVSTDEQVKGTSLEFQEELCRNYCEQKGIEIVALFREEGETAKDLSLHNRKMFLEALEFCRKNKNQIQAFIVLRVDRFARNTEDHFAIRRILLDYETTLHSVTEPIGNKPAEKFIETVLAGAAEYDNAIRKQRSSDGMIAKINQGIYPWKPPVGYKPLNSKKRGEKKTMPDPIDEQIFPIIQKGLKDYANKRYTQAELPQLLDKWGLKAVRGKKTLPQFVDRMLGRYLNFYAGIIVNPWTGEEKEGLHKPMITKEEMHQIRFIRSGKTKPIKKTKYNPEFPLRGTILCASCKTPLTGSTSHGRNSKYPYYHCHNHICQMFGKSIPKKELEQEFLKYLEWITPKDDFLEFFSRTVLDLWQEQEINFGLETERRRKQLELLEAKKKRIYEMREDGSYVKDEFIERKEEVENEIAAMKISFSEIKMEQFDIASVLTYATSFIRNLGRQWFDLRPELRPRFQKLLFPEGIPYERGKGFGTAQLGCIYELNRIFIRPKSHLVAHLRTRWNQIIQELQAWQELRNTMASAVDLL